MVWLLLGAMGGFALAGIGVLVLVAGLGLLAFTGTSGQEAMDYGEDARLDLLYDECEAGDLLACDYLYDVSPVGSAYEAFGATCGGRGAPDGAYCADERLGTGV